MKRLPFLSLAVGVALSLAIFPGPARALFESRGHDATRYAETIRVSGGGAAIAWVFEPLHEQFEMEAKVNLILDPCGPEHGLQDLLEGHTDVATAALPYALMVKLAQRQGISPDPADLRWTVVGKNRTMVLVHASNPVKTLDSGQLRGLFLGTVKNWSEVGGPDAPVVVVRGEKTPGQNELFSERFLGGAPVTANAVQVQDYADIVKRVGADPHAVSFAPEGLLWGEVRAPQTPELVAPVVAVTRGEPSGPVKKLFDFIAEVSQDL